MPISEGTGLTAPQNPLADLLPDLPSSAKSCFVSLVILPHVGLGFYLGLKIRVRAYLPEPRSAVGGIWIRSVADPSLTLGSIPGFFVDLG